MELCEFFPVEVDGDRLSLGISIPFKVMSDPRFASELTDVMTYLVSKGFQVVDLFTGDPLGAADIAGLPARISA